MADKSLRLISVADMTRCLLQSLFGDQDMGGLTFHYEFAVDRGVTHEVLFPHAPSAFLLHSNPACI